MYHKNSGDDIASAFKSLMTKKLQKKASYESQEAEMKMEDDAADAELDHAAKDMMVSHSQEDKNEDLLSEEIDMLSEDDFGPNSKEAKIMRGLGKIAASLRSKGEHFASDVVEATAKSIKGDFVKEASRRKMVSSELQKVARDMRIVGKHRGADLVEASIRRIKKG